MDNNELKVRSFRADNDTFEKFKQLAETEFSNQGQCLSALINLYETENSKAVLVNRGLEIESFQDYLNKISSLFLTSLQLNQDAEGRIREEFVRQLDSKDRMIMDLQGNVDGLSQANEALKEDAAADKIRIQEQDTQLQSFEDIIKKQKNDFYTALQDKDNLNRALTDSCNERKVEIDELRSAAATAADKLKELQAAATENIRLAAELAALNAEMTRQQELAALNKEKALLEADKLHQQELRELHSSHAEELKEYLNKIVKLQDQLTQTMLPDQTKKPGRSKKDPGRIDVEIQKDS